MFSIARRLVPTALGARRFTRTAIRLADAPPVPLEGEKLIHAKLTDRFAPSQLQVQDISGVFFFISVQLRSDSTLQGGVVISMPSLLRARPFRDSPW